MWASLLKVIWSCTKREIGSENIYILIQLNKEEGKPKWRLRSLVLFVNILSWNITPCRQEAQMRDQQSSMNVRNVHIAFQQTTDNIFLLCILFIDFQLQLIDYHKWLHWIFSIKLISMLLGLSIGSPNALAQMPLERQPMDLETPKTTVKKSN